LYWQGGMDLIAWFAFECSACGASFDRCSSTGAAKTMNLSAALSPSSESMVHNLADFSSSRLPCCCFSGHRSGSGAPRKCLARKAARAPLQLGRHSRHSGHIGWWIPICLASRVRRVHEPAGNLYRYLQRGLAEFGALRAFLPRPATFLGSVVLSNGLCPVSPLARPHHETNQPSHS